MVIHRYLLPVTQNLLMDSSSASEWQDAQKLKIQIFTYNSRDPTLAPMNAPLKCPLPDRETKLSIHQIVYYKLLVQHRLRLVPGWPLEVDGRVLYDDEPGHPFIESRKTPVKSCQIELSL